MTLRELIGELQAVPDDLQDQPLCVWDDREGEAWLSGVTVDRETWAESRESVGIEVVVFGISSSGRDVWAEARAFPRSKEAE